MKVTLLYHSGCLVELKSHLLLFDYYQGQLNLSQDKPLFVFVSHRHFDHYNPAIFKIKHPHITFILSTTLRHKYPAHYVEANQTYQFQDVTVQTLLSTDEGCAFLVQTENQVIYHAGDLNWWHWDEESLENNLWQKSTYQQQINAIGQKIDLACVVVDQRQKSNYLLGLQYFLDHVESRYILPIHYFGDYSVNNIFKPKNLHNPFHCHILAVKHDNQTFEI